MPIQKLKNNLRIFSTEFPSDNFVLTIYANAGLIYENENNFGISHFVEHLFTSNFPQKEVNLPQYCDFTTTDDSIDLSFHFPSNRLDYFLENIFEAMQNPNFSKTKIEAERKIIANEFRTNFEKDELYKIYPREMIGHAPLGTLKNLRKFAKSDLMAWHERIFTPENIVIGLASSPQNLKKHTHQIFAKLEKLKSKNQKPEANQLSPLQPKSISSSENKTYVCTSLMIENLELADLAYTILSQKFFRLCEKLGLYNVNLERHLYNNHFQIWYWEFEESKSHSQKILCQQTAFFKNIVGKITVLDLEKAKESSTFSLETRQNSIFSRLDFVCENLLKNEEIDRQKILRKYEKVSLVEVKNFVREKIDLKKFSYSKFHN